MIYQNMTIEELFTEINRDNKQSLEFTDLIIFCRRETQDFSQQEYYNFFNYFDRDQDTGLSNKELKQALETYDKAYNIKDQTKSNADLKRVWKK